MNRLREWWSHEWVRHATIFVGLFGFVLLVWYVMGGKPTKDWYPAPQENRVTDDAGKFGDSYGYVNSLLSSLAVIGVLYTLWMQIAENRASKQEHEENVRALFMSAYLNALNRAIENCDQMQKRVAGGSIEDRRFRFKYAALMQEADSLVERLRPVAATYLRGSPPSMRAISEQLDIAVGYLDSKSQQEVDAKDADKWCFWRTKLIDISLQLKPLLPHVRDEAASKFLTETVEFIDQTVESLGFQSPLDGGQVGTAQMAMVRIRESAEKLRKLT
jgi:hypothetical protein